MHSDGLGPPLMVIELVGTPGTGKTTLSREVVDLLRREGVAASTIIDTSRGHTRRTIVGRALAGCVPRRWRASSLWLLFYLLGLLHAIAFLHEQPRLGRHVVKALQQGKLPLARRIHVWFWFVQLGGRQRLLSATARTGEALVVDDGFLHRSVHLYASRADEPSATEIENYVDLLRAPQLVLRVVAARETCDERVRRRGLWRHSRNMTGEELSRYLANSDRVVGLAAKRAHERGWMVFDIDNHDRAPAQARPELLRALRASSVLSSAPLSGTTGSVTTGSAS